MFRKRINTALFNNQHGLMSKKQRFLKQITKLNSTFSIKPFTKPSQRVQSCLFQANPKRLKNSLIPISLTSTTSLLFLANRYSFALKKGFVRFWLRVLNSVYELSNLHQYIKSRKVKKFEGMLCTTNSIKLLSTQNYFKITLYMVVKRSWDRWKFRFNLLRRVFFYYARLYKFIGSSHIFSLYKKFQKIRYNPHIPIYNIFWTFTSKNRFFINMGNSQSRTYNYLSLYSGLFLKFFKQRRPLRRSKLFKVLMVKFFRKILIQTRVYYILFTVNRASPALIEFLRLLKTPNIVPYKNPNSTKAFNDSFVNKGKTLFSITKVIFRRTHSFTNMKTPNKGRLKRKITRRLLRKNRVLD